jgi:LuxR family transcriptional regulator, maltose regulon positive regulatory protein
MWIPNDSEPCSAILPTHPLKSPFASLAGPGPAYVWSCCLRLRTGSRRALRPSGRSALRAEFPVHETRPALGIRRIAQMRAFNLQAHLRLVIYAATMSSAEAAIALFTGQVIGQTSDRSVVQFPATRGGQDHSLENTWAVRRTIVRARSALISMRLDDASRATAQLKSLLSNRSRLYFFRYACALRILEAAILAAEDDLLASRSVLMSVASHNGDTTAATVLRYVHWNLGEREEICGPDPVDYLAAPVGGKVVCRILSLCVSAALAFDRLLLAVSASLATEALQLARMRYGNHSPMSTLPATLLAQVAYEQGRFDEAETLLRPRLSVIRTSGLLACASRANVLLARLALHRGRHRAALAILRETEALGRARRWPRLVSIASAEYARTLEILRYNEGQDSESDTRRRKATVVLLDGSRDASITSKPLHAPENQRMSSPARRFLAGASLETRSPDDALSFSAVETALRRACSAASRGPIDDSYEPLIQWLRIGAARGLRMAFVDAGRPLLTLLERLYYALPTNDPGLSDLRPYIATLLRSTVQSYSEESSSISYRPLSRRETGILQLIAHGMSNKHIARSLGITPETVKSHAKSIFVKLATRTRAQAVARAEAIGFL